VDRRMYVCIYTCICTRIRIHTRYISTQRRRTGMAAQAARGISRDESTRGAISGVCFAPRSRDQLRGSLRQRGTKPGTGG